jgi:hypothetical protein
MMPICLETVMKYSTVQVDAAAKSPSEVNNEARSRPGSVEQARHLKSGGKKPGSVRIQLTLRPEFVDTLDVLMEKTDAMSYSDVMRDAMRVYKWFVLESEKGNQICAREEDGSLSRLIW